jgi:hypothetical protein
VSDVFGDGLSAMSDTKQIDGVREEMWIEEFQTWIRLA